MIEDDSAFAATSAILQCLATSIHAPPPDFQAQNQGVKLPGPDTPAKRGLEREIAALVARVQTLETKAALAANAQNLPDTPNEIGSPSAFADVLTGRNAKNAASRQILVNSLLASRDAPAGERPRSSPSSPTRTSRPCASMSTTSRSSCPARSPS